ncbi:MAG: isoquinoline 1-oxidoreductase, partial [Marivirga sp.]|nr:isoquinoline 1-oxidoreductase [Marivirga sp.]
MDKQTDKSLWAPEQYELKEKPHYDFHMNRRNFFNVLGSGLAVTFSVVNSVAETLTSVPKDAEDQISAWIHVGENGIVTVYTGKAEVGQNIRTSLSQIVAEELDVAMSKIDMIMGDTSLTPYDQGTFGSRSIPYMGPQLRKAAASAREYLIDMAATTWKTDRGSLKLEKGIILNSKNKQSIEIGKLTKGKNLIKQINENVRVKPADQWKVAGTSVAKVNGESFITGTHKYVSDMVLPEMLYGKILRPPSYKAELVKVDVSAAQGMTGITVVHDGKFVGVAAPTLRQATDALKAIKADWTETPQPSR